jgi:RNA polymerase sigma factor (sigma-70 family)
VQTAEEIEHFLAGDPDMVGQARSWIRGTLLGYRASLGADIEDLEQEILVQLIEAFRDGRFRGQSGLKTYIKSFAHHKAIDRLRAAGRRQWIGLEDIDPPTSEDSIFDQLEQSQQVEIALRVVQEMPEQCRELWQRLEKGMNYQQMSAELGVAAGTLRARAMRCRQRALEIRRAITEKTHNKNQNRTTK